jgi:hypothetical protein
VAYDPFGPSHSCPKSVDRNALEDSEEEEINVENDVHREATIDDPSMQFLCCDAEKERTHCEAKESCC